MCGNNYISILFSQRDLPDYGGVLVYILLSDLLNTVLTEIIYLATDDEGNRMVAAVASVLSFLFSLVVFFGSLVIIDIVHNACKKTSANIRVRMCLVLAQCIGAVLYFFGNNSADISRTYGEELQCGENCAVMWRIAAMISLGSALAYYQLIPPCLHKIAKLYHYEDKRSDWFSSRAMIAVFIKIDALFNTVNLAAEKVQDQCGPFTVALTTIFVLVCITLGIGLIITNFIYSLAMLRKNQNDKHGGKLVAFVTSFVILILCFPPYLLTDNRQPLDCAFGCGLEVSVSGNNSSSGSNTCHRTGSSALRLVLSSVMFVIIIFVSFLLLLYKRKTAKKEMDSNLMYVKFN